MNALTRFRIVHDEATARAACAAEADMHISAAMEAISDEIAALYAPRRPLDDTQADRASRLRHVLVTLSHARDMNAPNMVERT